jgi:hypothetical protein
MEEDRDLKKYTRAGQRASQQIQTENNKTKDPARNFVFSKKCSDLRHH